MKRINLPYHIILASGSPRRQQLMREAGFEFSVHSTDVDERPQPDWDIYDVAPSLAEKKAAAAKRQLKITDNHLIIAADTIVIHGGEMLGKPENIIEAEDMLRRLGNSPHEVITGVAFEGAHEFTFTDITKVYMDHLTEDEIKYYVNNYLPLDKAGAYGVQEWIGHAKIRKIEGSYTNVMGLPMHKLYAAFELFLGPFPFYR